MKQVTRKSTWLAEQKIVTLMLDIDNEATLEYRNFLGSVEYSAEDKCYHGKVYDIDDLILYEGESMEDLMRDFRKAIDDYTEKSAETSRMTVEEALATIGFKAHMFSNIAADYDGYRTVEGLMGLIDEMRDGMDEIAKICCEHCSKETIHRVNEKLLFPEGNNRMS